VLQRRAWDLIVSGTVAVLLLVGCISREVAAETPARLPLPSHVNSSAPELDTLSTRGDTSARPSAQNDGALQDRPGSPSGDNGIVRGVLAAKLDGYLASIVPYGFSGALLVATDEEIILNKGYGMADRAGGLPNTAETVFSIGSITKQFTAAGIMKLEMQGKLSTTDPIGEYLDGVPEDKAGITLHHLLTHTSGLVEDVGRDYDTARRDQTVKKILDLPLEFTPGEEFEYTNVGYTLLAAIIEKVSGQPYEEFLHEQLFRPAGMAFTGYRIPNWDERVIAHWYRGDIDNGTPLEKPYPYWNLMGNGGILSTTEDMYRWHLALQGNAVLSADAKKKLFTPFLKNYAYGWDVLQTEHGTLIEHNGGSMLGNSAEYQRYVDSDVVIVLFCNQSYGSQPLSALVKGNIETLVFGGDVEIPPSSFASDPPVLKRFKGSYGLPSGGRLSASIKNGFLVLTAEGQDAINLLVVPDQTDLTLQDDLNTRSVMITEAIVKGDYSLLEEARVKERKGDYHLRQLAYQVRQYVDMVLRRGKAITGAIQKVEAVGTVRSSSNKDVAASVIELAGEKRSLFFHLTWLKGELFGLRPDLSAQSVTVLLLPLSESDFAGYHLGYAQNVRVSFNLNDEGVVADLTVHEESGDVELHKLSPYTVSCNH